MLHTAIILAGGFGTRLQDVVKDLPKPLAPVNGQAFLTYQFRYLKHFGIQQVILSVGYLADKIHAQYKNNYLGINIIYAIEQEPLGTGGGIRLALETCEDKQVLVLNGDSFFDVPIDQFYEQHQLQVSSVSLALRKVQDASRYGTIERDERHRIIRFREKSGEHIPGIINGGIYILDKDIFLQHTPASKNFSIEKDFFENKLGEVDMKGYLFEGYFIDIGIPQDYQQAQHDFKGFKY